jgi:hypothetical protein
MSTLTPSAAGLERARDAIFSMGLEDSAARLCAANMVYGLAKTNHVLETLGYPPDAIFIATPDMTITRNTARWQAGFGYGGKVQWGDGDRPLLILDVKPNGCGMLVGGLTRRPDPQVVVQRLNELKAAHARLSGIEIAWDFGRGNHFIDICQVQPVEGDPSLPPYAFVMHGSCPELHGETALGPGAYWDASPALQRQARLFETPWGPLHVLLDDAVQPFVEFWSRADQFARERRLIAARHCFGDFQVISNETHQGMQGPNAVLLGCHDSQPASGDLLPVMVRSDLPGYLFEGLPNLSEATIDGLGFRPRAEALGVLHRLKGANVIPHGAGYSIPHLRDVLRVIEVDSQRYFEMSTIEEKTTELVQDLHDVQQKYRGRQPVLKALECGLGRMVASLTPLSVIKA